MAPSVAVSAAPNCPSRLSAVRAAARERQGWLDRGCDVLDNGRDYYVVKDEHGEFVWEGQAHCRWCARTSAVEKMADAKYVLLVDGKETLTAYPSLLAAMSPAIKAHDAGAKRIRLRSPMTAVFTLKVQNGVAFSWAKEDKPLQSEPA